MLPPNQLQAPLGAGQGIQHHPGHPRALEMAVLLPGHSANSMAGTLLGEVTRGLGWFEAGDWNSSSNQIFLLLA